MRALLWVTLGSALLSPAAAECVGARVVPLPGASRQFAPLQLPSLSAALDAGAVDAAATAAGETGRINAWRVISGWSSPAADTVTLTPPPSGDASAAWTAAITDGAGQFYTFGPGSAAQSAYLTSGDFGITLDVVTAPNSTGVPTLSTMRYDAAWTTCGEAPHPEPACSLRPSLQPWAQFGDAEVGAITVRALTTVGWARMSGLDVVVTGLGACMVTVAVQVGASWAQVGAAPFAGGTHKALTVELDTLLTVVAGSGVTLLVSATEQCTLLVATSHASLAAPGDGAYGAAFDGGAAIVGGVHSVPACAAPPSIGTGRSAQAELVTPASTTAFSVSGWDPETRIAARVNLFTRLMSDSKTLIPRVLPSMLAIPNGIFPAHSFVLTNMFITGLSDPTADYCNGLRTAIARALKPHDLANMDEALGSVSILQSRISLALAMDYRDSEATSLPVSVQTTLPSILDYLIDIENEVNTFVNGKSGPGGAAKVKVTGAQPASRVEVLVYTKPGSDIIVTRGLIRDQYNAYIKPYMPSMLGTQIISIGEVFYADGREGLPVPALSKTPLIASSAASAAWGLLLIGASVRSRYIGVV